MDELRTKYLDAIGGAADEAALEDIRVQAVGKKHDALRPKGKRITNPKKFRRSLKYHPNPEGEITAEIYKL